MYDSLLPHERGSDEIGAREYHVRPETHALVGGRVRLRDPGAEPLDGAGVHGLNRGTDGTEGLHRVPEDEPRPELAKRLGAVERVDRAGPGADTNHDTCLTGLRLGERPDHRRQIRLPVCVDVTHRARRRRAAAALRALAFDLGPDVTLARPPRPLAASARGNRQEL